MPAASLIPLRARRALRSTSRRTRSRIICGLGTVGTGFLRVRGAWARPGAGAATLGLQLDGQPPDLAVQRTDLRAQPADVAAGRQVEQVPGAGGEAPGGTAGRRLRAPQRGRPGGDRRRPDEGLRVRGHRLVDGVVGLPPQRRRRWLLLLLVGHRGPTPLGTSTARRRILPVGPLGSSSTSQTCRGYLYAATRAFAHSRSSSGSADAPGLRATAAATSSPSSGCVTPTQATSATAGCS